MCGLAFEYQYVRHLPSPSENAKAILGNIIHGGVERWYGGEGPRTPENENAHKEQSLIEIVKEEWPERPAADDAVPEEYVQRRYPPGIWNLIAELADLDEGREALASAITMVRPEIKAPKQTQDFLQSEEQTGFNAKMNELLKLQGEFNEIHWAKDENAFQAYQRSLIMARRIELEWKLQPRPLLVEEPFRLEFEGFVLRGRIDQVRQDIDPKTGELVEPRVRDIKTGKEMMTQQEAFLQAFIYITATKRMDYAFLPSRDILDFDFYMTRHIDAANRIKRQVGHIDLERHGKLALRILSGAANIITSGSYEPHYGRWCKMCDFKDICDSEIRIWDGDGVVVGMS
jgi:CRISPR/Cas system-associated exonuclease Cas4 (RecB family)